MRTFVLLCVVALLVACGVAYAVGLVAVTADHSDGKCVVSLIVNTAMLRHDANPDSATNGSTSGDGFQDVTGKIAAVRPDKNEVVVSENIKNWTFQLAKDGKVSINDRDSKLSELKAGDDATVTFDRQGEKLIASAIRCTRK